LILLSFVSLYVFITKISYAATTIEKSSQTWRCLKGGDSHYDLTWHNPPSPPTLTQQLSGDGFIDGRDIYVVACLPGNNTTCSTGEANPDILLFGKDNSTSKTNSWFDGTSAVFNVITINGGSKKQSKGGKITATANVGGANVVGTGGYTFYGVMVMRPNDLTNQPGLGAEQQGTFNFTGKQDLSKCVKISWTHYDPFGIVFDSQSLEPLSNVAVTILDNKKKKLSLIGFPNPQITRADGIFNFLVEPGDYYLEINPMPSGYQFIQSPAINVNYSKIYHQADGGVSIYKPNEVIREIIDTPDEQVNGVPDPERRDIPLDPGKNPPFTTSPVIMGYGVTRHEEQTEIEGKVSHPFTTITILQANEIIASQEADREGFFDILVDNTRIHQDLAMTLRLTKKDLTGNLGRNLLTPNHLVQRDIVSYFTSLFSPSYLKFDVRAENLQLGRFKIIQPIFALLKGYAYDKIGRTVSNADVSVKLAMTNSTYYKTKADQNGYFDVPPENLPIFNYDVSVSSPFLPAPVTYSTSEFAKANKIYLASNTINLMKITTNKKTKSSNNFAFTTRENSLQATSTGSAGENLLKSADSQKNFPLQKTRTKKQTSSNRVLTLLALSAFFIAGIILLGTIVYLVLKEKKQQAV
ncbi:carboxypeptidase regulatory-like domain-containing protein, partial [Candidatus Roizmanbacteria bacterium]|nr:carboxypeptidase regulatory-like domain-containing protein [Candidatus Roizmanbacteria bacterium]